MNKAPVPISPPTFFEQHFRALLGAIVLGAGLLYVGLNPQYQTGVLNDDAVYVIASHDLSNRYVSHLYPAIKPDRPLPGLPILLAPFSTLSHAGLPLVEWVMPLVAMVSVCLLGVWVRRWLTAGETLMVVLVYAFNPVVAQLSGLVMPETAYTATVIAGFVMLSRMLEAPSTTAAAALGLIAGWGSLIRPEGALLLPCLLIPVVISPRARKYLPDVAVPIVGWVLVMAIWYRTHASSTSEFGGDLSALASYWTRHFVAGLGFAWTVLRVFLVNVVSAFHFPKTVVVNAARSTLVILCLIIMGAGIKDIDVRLKRPLEFWSAIAFCGGYFLVHLFWHVAEPRYFVPLLPFAMVFFVRGVGALLKQSPRRIYWTRLAIAVFAVSYGANNAVALRESLTAPDPMKSPPWQSLSWLKENTEPGVKVVSIFAPSIALYAGLPSSTNVQSAGVERFVYERTKKGYRYIADRPRTLITPGVGNTVDANKQWARVRRWIRRYPNRFPRVYANRTEKVKIYRIAPEPRFMEAYEKFREAARLFQRGQASGAFDSVQECLSVDPNLGSALNLLGALYVIQGDYAKGEKYFLRALEERPESAVSMLNLATLYRSLGRMDLYERYIAMGRKISADNGKQRVFAKNLRKLESDPAGHIMFVDNVES